MPPIIEGVAKSDIALKKLKRKTVISPFFSCGIIISIIIEFVSAPKDLAEFIVIDIFSITRATSALVKRGLLTRRVNQQDRRKIELRLSARGRKVYDQIVPVALAVERAVFSVLSKNESNQLDHILLKLEEHIGQLLTPDRSWKSFVADPKS